MGNIAAEEEIEPNCSKVTFFHGESRGDTTLLGYFICPVCRKANYIASGGKAQTYSGKDSCCWCGTRVYCEADA